MVERKKRKSNHKSNNENRKRQISNDNDEKINKDELVIYRILCPVVATGGVIGKSGKVITAIRNITKAKIKVAEQLPNCTERVITIYCSVNDKQQQEQQKDEIDITKSEIEPVCCAQDALLKVHDAIVNSVVSSVGDNDAKKSRDYKKECRLLVPSSQSSSVIGKAGSNIKKIRSSTRASVKVVSKDVSDPSHICALAFDNIVLISGEPESVKKALFDVSSIMYRTNPREEIPLDSTVQDVQPDLSHSLHLQTGLYTNHDPILHHGAGAPSFFSSLTVPDHQGYAETNVDSMPVLGGSSRSQELVLKVLCPLSSISRVIGVEGSTIKRIREESGSCIEIDKPKHGDDECVIVVTATESPDDMKSMAVEAVLLLQETINEEEKVKMQFLVPSKVTGCVIGKSGSVITEIRKRTNANIRISKGNSDDLVQVSGEVSSVRNALVQIVLRLREDVLGNVAARKPPARSDYNSFVSSSSNPGVQLPSFTTSSVQEFAPVNFDRRRETGRSSLGMVSPDGFYGYGSFVAEDNYYGSVGPYSYGGLRQSSAVEILVPANAMGRVMGRGGIKLENIRRISGAMIEISDSRTSHGDHIALLSGTAEQMRTAENLFRAFIMSM